MGRYFTIALVVGLAIGSVNASFAWYDYRSPRRALRTFAGWLLAFIVAGLVAPIVAEWLLTHVF